MGDVDQSRRIASRYLVDHGTHSTLARGVKVTGATVHYVDDGMDTGAIILQKAVLVEEGDTPEILQRRVMEQAEWVILPQAIDMIANKTVTQANEKLITLK